MDPNEEVCTSAPPYEEDLVAAIRQFRYDSLSGTQEKVIRANIEGRHTLAIMPTGGGKSACYQIPGVVTQERTLVISPLIALQEDQIAGLRELGIMAFALHSGMDEAKKQAVHYYFKYGPKDEASFLYLSPELLMTEMFHERFDSAGFYRLAVDEAHCVSTWGNSFRPDYQRIRVAAQRLDIPHCSAYTATVDPRIEKDIEKRIPLDSNFLRVAADPMRPNLKISITNPAQGLRPGQRGKGVRRLNALLDLLVVPEFMGTTIVYFSSRGGAVDAYFSYRDMSSAFGRKFHTPYLFHRMLPHEAKQEALKGFRKDIQPIIFATSAFGMGINRADVRQIIHHDTPISLIDYAQQIGRGGRDGLPALCTTFHDKELFLTREEAKVDKRIPKFEFVERTHTNLLKVLRNIKPENRSKYNVQSFIKRLQILLEKSGDMTQATMDKILQKTMTSLAILQNIGVIEETNTGLKVHRIVHGSGQHLKLLEKTEMQKRMEVREKQRLAEFFGNPDADQALLWELLQKE